MTSPWLTTGQAAAIVGCDRTSVWRRAHGGEIPAAHLSHAGRHLRVSRAWAESQRLPTTITDTAGLILPGTMPEADARMLEALCA